VKTIALAEAETLSKTAIMGHNLQHIEGGPSLEEEEALSIIEKKLVLNEK
jgi:hypothetical protein